MAYEGLIISFDSENQSGVLNLDVYDGNKLRWSFYARFIMPDRLETCPLGAKVEVTELDYPERAGMNEEVPLAKEWSIVET